MENQAKNGQINFQSKENDGQSQAELNQPLKRGRQPQEFDEGLLREEFAYKFSF